MTHKWIEARVNTIQSEHRELEKRYRTQAQHEATSAEAVEATAAASMLDPDRRSRLDAVALDISAGVPVAVSDFSPPEMEYISAVTNYQQAAAARSDADDKLWEANLDLDIFGHSLHVWQVDQDEAEKKYSSMELAVKAIERQVGSQSEVQRQIDDLKGTALHRRQKAQNLLTARIKRQKELELIAAEKKVLEERPVAEDATGQAILSELNPYCAPDP
ncbi:MAG: uncharacterized protein KVP18_000722 [Porospora cf. gigantea A]|nr:MAG: hypothetical protein KVP18_000722 [Porospora cf. gigantea A]